MAYRALTNIIWHSDHRGFDEVDMPILDRVELYGPKMDGDQEVEPGNLVPTIVPLDVVKEWAKRGLVKESPDEEAPEIQSIQPTFLMPLTPQQEMLSRQVQRVTRPTPIAGKNVKPK